MEFLIISINLPWSAMLQTKFGPDRFSRSLDTKKTHLNRQTSNVYVLIDHIPGVDHVIYAVLYHLFLSPIVILWTGACFLEGPKNKGGLKKIFLVIKKRKNGHLKGKFIFIILKSAIKILKIVLVFRA